MREDEEIRQPRTHQIDEILDDFSVLDLEARIMLLQDEIARLEMAKLSKQKAAEAATAFFKT